VADRGHGGERHEVRRERSEVEPVDEDVDDHEAAE